MSRFRTSFAVSVAVAVAVSDSVSAAGGAGLHAGRTAVQPTITDVAGKPIRPQTRPRIVSVAPALTETLYAIGAGKALIAVSDFCNYPPAAAKLPRIGALTTLNFEKVVALRPTLVVTAAGSRDQWLGLRNLVRTPVYVAPEGGIGAVRRSIRDLGYLTGRDRSAAALDARIAAKLAAMTQANRGRWRPRVFFMVWDDPLMTAGRGSYLHDLIAAAGGRNIGADLEGTYPRMAWERLVAEPPDILIGTANLRAASEAAGRRARASRTAILDRDIVSRPGPRVLEALDLFERAIHQTNP